MRIVLAAIIAVTTASAHARPPRRLAVVPISAVGSEASKAQVRELTTAIDKAVSHLDGLQLVPAGEVEATLKRDRRKSLQTCDGDTECLALLGKNANVDYVLFGEVGGLGAAQVIYFRVIGVEAGRDLRSTTLEIAGADADDKALQAAMVRLFTPSRYVGAIDLDIDVAGATVYIDGTRVEHRSKHIEVPVGSHALRVTHPEFRDFVRFIDIGFEETLPVEANLQQFPVIASQMREHPRKQAVPLSPVPRTDDEPWYSRWYTVTGIGVGAFVTGAVIFALVADGIDADSTRSIDVP